MPLLDPQARRALRRLFVFAALAAALAVPSAARAYDAIRPFTPLAAHLADLARRTGQPLAPMLAAPHPWTPPAPDAEAVARRAATIGRSEPVATSGSPAPIKFAEALSAGASSPIAVGDLNGDGSTDLVVYGTAGGIALRFGTSDGFAPAVEYPLPGSPGPAAVGDTDGDGRPDLAVWIVGSGLAILRGNGDGTLAPAVLSPLAGAPSSLALADLDGDHFADAVALESSDSTLIVARGAGDGTFPGEDRYVLADGAGKFVIGDFNGDGLDDVAVICRAWETTPTMVPIRALSVLLSVGGGALGARADYIVSRLPWSLAAGDVDGDGRDDLAVSWFAGAGADVFHSLPDGSFEAPTTCTVDSSSHAWSVMTLADVDADGRLDLLIGSPDGDCYDGKCLTLTVLRGNGDGSFTDRLLYLLGNSYDSFANTETLPFFAADFDGDHVPDLLMSIYSRYSSGGYSFIQLIRGRRSGGLLAPARTPVGTGPYALGAGHFRSGAPADLVSSGSSAVALVRNRGYGSFLPPVDLAPGALGAVADLDGDGFDDVVIARAESTTVLFSDGAGGFVTQDAGTSGPFVAVGDFTGDGLDDIAVMLPGGNLGVLPNEGARHFGAALDYGLSLAGARVVRAADLDGDGRADFMIATWNYDDLSSSDSLEVYWNRGGGFLTPAAFAIGPRFGNYRALAPPADIKVGDFDGDRRLDVVVTKGTDGYLDESGTIQILLNRGGRDFAPAVEYEVGVDPYESAVADFDGDGLDDIAVADVHSSYNGRVFVFRSLGSGDFEMACGGPVEHFSDTIVAADFDGDGRPDLSVGCLFPSDIITLPNLSPLPVPTPVLAALIDSRASCDRVSLTWLLTSSRPAEVTVERRAPSESWRAIGTAPVDGTEHVAFEDRAVVPGARYAYRLRLGQGSLATTTAESWIDVPALTALSVAPAGANPSREALRVAFALPGTEPARLDLFDLSGRRVRTRRLAATGAGRGEIAFENDGSLGPGLYFVTLTQGARTASTKIALIR